MMRRSWIPVLSVLTPLAGLGALALFPVGPAVSAPRLTEPAASDEAYVGTWAIDSMHSAVSFDIEHMGLTMVRGRFREFSGEIKIPSADLTKASVTATAKIASVDTAVPARDEHLRSADFFDAAKYPDLTFVSKVVRRDGDQLLVDGTLTIKDKSKDITIPIRLAGPVEDPRAGARIGVNCKPIVIDRLDFGVGRPAPLPGGGLAIGNDVHIQLFIEAVKQP